MDGEESNLITVKRNCYADHNGSTLLLTCPYCYAEVTRFHIDAHVRAHSPSYYYHFQRDALYIPTQRRVDPMKRYHHISSAQKVELTRDDVRKKPILFTDPIYFDEVFAAMHQMRGPLFTRFTLLDSELETLPKEWRPYFQLVKRMRKGSPHSIWQCPLPGCRFKTTYYEDALSTIFIALCHLVNHLHPPQAVDGGVKSESVLCDKEDLAAEIREEWECYNHVAGTSFNSAEVVRVEDYPVKTFDDYLPGSDTDKRFIEQFFSRSHQRVERNHGAYFCRACLKLFTSPEAFTGHMDTVHGLALERQLFIVDERRLGSGKFSALTPCWFPLAMVVRHGGQGTTRLEWSCFQCGLRVQGAASDLLLVLIKALLHFHVEIYSVYRSLSNTWPSLLLFCVYIGKNLPRVDAVPSCLSVPTRLLIPLVHPSAIDSLPHELRRPQTSTVHEGRLRRKGRTGDVKVMIEQGEPFVHCCLQCERYLGVSGDGGELLIKAHLCTSTPISDKQLGEPMVLENQSPEAWRDSTDLVSLVRRIHQSSTAGKQFDYELREATKGVRAANLKRYKRRE